MLHASAEWTRAHWDDERGAVIARLARAVGAPTTFAFVQAHRWRYATPTTSFETPSVVDPALRLALAGDWLGGSRIEGAFLSGLDAARRIISAD